MWQSTTTKTKKAKKNGHFVPKIKAVKSMSFNHIFNAKNHTMFVEIVQQYICYPMALQCTIIHCYCFYFDLLFFFYENSFTCYIAVIFKTHTVYFLRMQYSRIYINIYFLFLIFNIQSHITHIYMNKNNFRE